MSSIQLSYGRRFAAGGGRTVAFISYGGTSLITLLAGFGILMSTLTVSG
jgi:hypothetical protein